ncbi:MAG: T9SS type A sorting domain-containing protein [Candidatus Latescibacteria bacterium]|nr:T9SS type A sorting domain-containing protein [Candidatus Latescibacterota bacterium]
MKYLKIVFAITIFWHAVTLIHADGTWTQYQSSQNTHDIAFEGQYVWCATNGGVIRWNKEDNTHTILTTNEGLANNSVLSVYVGRDGVKWFGTKSGVTKYDGKTFTTFTTKDGLIFDWVTAIYKDSMGILWFGTQEGVSKFDGTLWTSITTENGLISNYILAIEADKKNMTWVISTEGISVFDGNTWKIFSKRDVFNGAHISDFTVGPDGNIWVATNHVNGLWCYDGVTWKNYDIDVSIESLDFDSNGVLWMGAEGKICCFDGTLLSCFSESLQYEYSDYFIVAVDSNDTKWIGSISSDGKRLGLSSFDGKFWTHHAINSIINSSVHAVTVDHDNIKWFGTENGISSFDGVHWTSYSAEDEFVANGYHPFIVYGACVDLNNIKWFTTRYGIKNFDGESWETYTKNDSLSFNKFHTVVIDHDNVKWFASTDGVCSFDGTEWKRYTVDDGLIDNVVNTIAVDNNNGLWFGTDYGVSYFDRINWMTFTEETGMPSVKVTSIAVDKNNVKWFGGETVLSFDGITWEEHRFYSEPLNPLCGGALITVDKNNIVWVVMAGTCTDGSSIPGGLASYDGTTWTTYENDLGISRFRASGIAVDDDNTKWFATANGAISYKDKPGNAVEEKEKLPETLTITGNYPNPFNPSTTIEFTVPESGFADLIIYNVLGQRVRNLLSKTIPAGTHTIIFNGKDDNGIPVSSGLYISQLRTGKMTSIHKMVLYK